MKIVIATGGSGGHLFPAIKAAEELRRKHCQIHFWGSFKVGREMINKAGFSYEELPLQGFNLGRWQDIPLSAWLMGKAMITSRGFLRKYDPDAVVGFGGYGAFPVMWAAVLLRYPTLIHEQNVVPGRANAVLSRFVDKIAVSFPQTAGYPGMKGKSVVTGCPSHVPQQGMDRNGILEKFGLKADRKTILVLGGSQGSHRINAEFIKTAEDLKNDMAFQVIHIAGKQDYAGLQAQYRQMGIPFVLFEFFEQMPQVYHVSDMIVSRAGAVTVTEIIRFQKPAVLIPYPHAGNHQKKNAQVLSEAGLGRLIEERALHPGKLKEMILSLLANPLSAEQWERNFKDFFSDESASRVAEEIMSLKTKK